VSSLVLYVFLEGSVDRNERVSSLQAHGYQRTA
jgi:hypothetical protein